MTTTPDYVCRTCGADLPLWNFSRLLTAAGLEALYRQICQERLRAGMKIPTKLEFLESPGACFVTPPMLLKLLATGIAFNAAPQVASAAPAYLKLVTR